MGNPYLTIRIPVQKEVKNYLLLNPFIKKPLRLTHQDPVGCYLMGMLRPKSENKYLPAHLPRYNDDSVIEISLSGNKCYDYRFWMPPHRARMFCNWVKKQMWIELYNNCIQARRIERESNKFKMNLHKLIHEFEDRYLLHNTQMNFETMRKDIMRKHQGFKTIDTSTIEKTSLKLSLNDT